MDIYLAFDAGEWDCGDSKDPVATYTIPMSIEKLDGLGPVDDRT